MPSKFTPYRYTKLCHRPTCSSFHNSIFSDWSQIRLSLSLLRIADQLTDNSSGFKLYFLDVSLDNYAVDPTTERVYISDAEHIMVVDEQHLRSKRLLMSLGFPFIIISREMLGGGGFTSDMDQWLKLIIQSSLNAQTVPGLLVVAFHYQPFSRQVGGSENGW